MCSRVEFRSVYCEVLRGSLLGILYLYRWYNHTTFILNDYMGVLNYVVCLMHHGIVPITIAVYAPIGDGWGIACF